MYVEASKNYEVQVNVICKSWVCLSSENALQNSRTLKQKMPFSSMFDSSQVNDRALDEKYAPTLGTCSVQEIGIRFLKL